MKRIYRRCCGIDVHKGTLTELEHAHTRVANRLHKVLQDADFKLSSVMSDILRVSDRRILQ
jgi:hypothetical protein